MRAILALGLFITLCASADAAPAHHRGHAVANPTQVFTPGVRSGFAYAPDGPAAPAIHKMSQTSFLREFPF